MEITNEMIFEKLLALEADIRTMKTSIQFIHQLYMTPVEKKRTKRKTQDELVQEILAKFDRRVNRKPPQ